MELNITVFFREAAPKDYAASAAEIGNDAGAATWRAAIEDSAEYLMLDTDDKREDFRDFVREFGAWSEEEIAAWSDIELNALCIQWIAGNIREHSLSPSMADAQWAELENREGYCPIYRRDDGEIYWIDGASARTCAPALSTP